MHLQHWQNGFSLHLLHLILLPQAVDLLVRAKEPLGKHVILHHDLLRNPQRQENDRCGKAGTILARGTVHQKSRVLHIQYLAEHLGVCLALSLDKISIDLHHEIEHGLPITELTSQLLEKLRVTAGTNR